MATSFTRACSSRIASRLDIESERMHWLIEARRSIPGNVIKGALAANDRGEPQLINMGERSEPGPGSDPSPPADDLQRCGGK